jgi:hypothetical protein
VKLTARCLRLRRERFSQTTFGSNANFSRVHFKLSILCLLGVSLESNRLVSYEPASSGHRAWRPRYP